MSHILLRLGEAALLPRRISVKRWLGPILSRRQALEIRKEWLAKGRCAHRAGARPAGAGRAAAPAAPALDASPPRRCAAAPRREWPYEHLVPGIHTADPYRGGYQKGTKRERNREARCARRQEATGAGRGVIWACAPSEHAGAAATPARPSPSCCCGGRPCPLPACCPAGRRRSRTSWPGCRR
jgi:hypothetical protein